MGTQQLRVILDDNTGDIKYSGTDWSLNAQAPWYLGTTTYPPSTGNGVFGSFSLTFEGTSIAFVGNTPNPDSAQFATYSIDGENPYNSSYQSLPGRQSYLQWYQSPLLSDGKHTITVDHLDGTAIDMAIITVGPRSSLTNRLLFVDNNDPAIQYAGAWVESQSGFNAGTLPDGLPVGNTTQRSTTPGDTMSFQFTGTAISIYGIFSWANIGTISATYNLDGVVQTLSYPVTVGSPQFVRADGEVSNFLFFNNGSLPAGDHTLVMTISDVQNTTFILDYITYSPSFTSLATMPNLTSASTTSTRPTSGSSMTKTSVTPDSTNTHPNSGASRGNGNGLLIGGIVGGIAGGLIIVLLIITIWHLRKRRSNRIRSLSLESEFDPYSDNSTSPIRIGMSSIQPTNAQFDLPLPVSTNVTPFPATATPSAGTSSMSDLKRDARMVQDQERTPSPFSSEARTSYVPSSDSGHRPNTLVVPDTARTAQTASTDALEYVSDSVPPAYEALSPH